MQKAKASRSTIGRDPWGTVIPSPDEAGDPSPPARARPRGRPPKRATTPAPADRGLAAPATAPSPAPARESTAPGHPALNGSGPAEPRYGREKLTVHLDGALVNRVKNAAYWNPRLTIARIAEAGIRLAIEQVEREHGGPYPHREAELIGGRPIK